MASLSLLPAHSNAIHQKADPDRAAALARRATDRIRVLQHEAEALASQERTLLVDLRRLEVERQLKTEESAGSIAKSTRQPAKLDAAATRVGALETTAMGQGPAVRARLVDLYKLGRPGYARLLLDVTDLRSLGRAYRLVSELARRDAQRVAEHRQTLERLRAQRAQLVSRSRRVATLQVEARSARTAFDQAVAARERLIRAIDGRRDLNAQLTGELQVAHQNLQSSVNALAARTETAVPALLPLRPFRGVLDWPGARAGRGAIRRPARRYRACGRDSGD